MEFGDLLRLDGVPNEARIKVYRHTDTVPFLDKLRRLGHLETYQAMQSRRIFECDLVAVFIALDSRRAQLYGLYEVQSRNDLDDADLHEMAAASPWWSDPRLQPPRIGPRDPLWWHGSRHHYKLKRTGYLASLADRLVLDFGRFGKNSARHLGSFDELPIYEIKAPGRHEPFPGFDRVLLEMPTLERLVDHPTANADWHHALSSVAGVYLISVAAEDLDPPFDQRRLYVGSATGRQNLWQRWSDYARTGHGENAQLRALLERHPNARDSFQFSILQTAPLTMQADQVRALERDYKLKLQTVRFGLNENL